VLFSVLFPKGAQAVHTMENNGFLQLFNFCLRAGERRGKQKTNAITSKHIIKRSQTI